MGWTHTWCVGGIRGADYRKHTQVSLTRKRCCVPTIRRYPVSYSQHGNHYLDIWFTPSWCTPCAWHDWRTCCRGWTMSNKAALALAAIELMVEDKVTPSDLAGYLSHTSQHSEDF